MKGYKIYLAIGSLLLIIYLVAQYNKPTPTDWTPTYAKQDKIPYGTYILSNQIKDILPQARVITSNTPAYNSLKNKKFKSTSYLIVAQKADISQLDYAALKKFMTLGNTVFIAAYDFGDILEKELAIKTSTNLTREGTSLNFTNPALKTSVNYGFDKGIGNQFFVKTDTNRITVLGKNSEGEANFVKYPIGDGTLYLIAEPGFYSNFNLLDKDGAEYAAKTLSYIQMSDNLIYDTYFSKAEAEGTDLLRVFFKHPELEYAYYLAIFSLLIFVLYDVKRRQRIIPVADPYANSSVAFVNVVGSVYYHQRDNLDIALKKINYLMEYLRTRYFIKTNEIDSAFAQTLVQKTGISEVFAKNLTRYFIQIPQLKALNDTELINLNESIEQFYKQTNGARTI